MVAAKTIDQGGSFVLVEASALFVSIDGTMATVTLDPDLACTADELASWAAGLDEETDFLSVDPDTDITTKNRRYTVEFGLDGTDDDSPDSLTDDEREELMRLLNPRYHTGVMATATVVRNPITNALIGVKVVLQKTNGVDLLPANGQALTGIARRPDGELAVKARSTRIAVMMAEPTFKTSKIGEFVQALCDDLGVFLEGEVKFVGFDDDNELWETFPAATPAETATSDTSTTVTGH